MLQIKITIETINAAFDENAQLECARILREIADNMAYSNTPTILRDYNGNKCGSVEVIGS